jgi:probable F420-dependent oxidoreductase
MADSSSGRQENGSAAPRFGVLLPNLGGFRRPETVEPFAKRMEELGYEYLFAGDHVALPVVPESRYVGSSTGVAEFTSDSDIYEPLTLISYLAGVTRTVRLGIAVQILPYRNPVLNAKMITTLDVLAQGRIVLGVGVGWCREEFEALGASFDDRGAVVDEQIEIYKQAASGHEINFTGAHYEVRGTRLLPRPKQRPHPPLWIGGTSRRARRRAALLGDGWYPIRLQPDQVAQGVEEILALRAAHGLPTDEYPVTVGIPVHFGAEPLPPAFRVAIQGDADEMAEQIAAYQRAGVCLFVIRSSSNDFDRASEDMERFAELRSRSNFV